MPAVLNFAANLVLGGAVVLALQKSRALRRDLLSWPLLVLIAFEALVFTPIATYLFRFYPQWSMLYLFDPQIFPELDNWIGLLSLSAVLLNFAGVLFGFYATRDGVLRDKRWLTYCAPGTGAGLALLCFAFFAKRIVFLGDFDAFWQGTANLAVTKLAGWLGLLLYVSGALFVTFLHRRFADHDPKCV